MATILPAIVSILVCSSLLFANQASGHHDNRANVHYGSNDVLARIQFEDVQRNRLCFGSAVCRNALLNLMLCRLLPLVLVSGSHEQGLLS